MILKQRLLPCKYVWSCVKNNIEQPCTRVTCSVITVINMLIITIVIVSNYKLKALLSKNVLSVDLDVSIIQAFLVSDGNRFLTFKLKNNLNGLKEITLQ